MNVLEYQSARKALSIRDSLPSKGFTHVHIVMF
jgi:hypothetical protein